MGFTVEERRQYSENRANELKELLANGVADLEKADNWQNYLKAQAKFHNYSFKNAMIIFLQMPEATRVASYATWKSVGRQVKKGEKGLSIFVPKPAKVYDENGNVKKNDKGEDMKQMRFGTGNVFDISQTDIVDEEKWAEHDGTQFVQILTEGGDEDIYSALQAVSAKIGFEFFEDDLFGFSNETNGYTTLQGDKEIHVRESLPLAQKIKTTIHELGHAMMHASDKGDEVSEDGKNHRGIAELEAESVAFIVCDVLGIDSSVYTIGYLAGWSAGDSDKIRELGESVNKSSKKILELLDEVVSVSA